MKIDGGLEARHFLGDSAAVGLVTRLGPIDVILEPRGFEDGYLALVPRSTRLRRGDVEIRVGALADLVRSMELLRRAKDVEHLVCCASGTRSAEAPPRLDHLLVG